MRLDLKNLRYYLISGQEVPAGYTQIYENSYNMWKQVWSQALTDLNSPQPIFSDGFTRQTKIGCIFHEEQCIAMSAFREVDFSCVVHNDDSLLRSWTPASFDQLISEGTRVSICSYLSVAPSFRGLIAPDMTLKLLTVLMSTECLLSSNCDVMTGTMRCNKGTDKAAYRAGARFIQKSEMYGVEVDLVGFFRKEILQKRLSCTHLWSETLWKNRIDLTNSKIDSDYYKKVG
jgi:hypothetical protein